MLKLFRRIRRKLLDEGKMRKYLVYAIGEISLVVIGILIALQVNTWNDVRKEREEEYLALKSLHEEFVESRELFGVYQRHHKEIFDGMKYLLEILDAKGVNERLVDSIYINLDKSAMSSGKFEPSRGIINSLINSGNINIISNEKLKSHLIKWNDQVINFQNVQSASQDYKFTYLFPLISRMTQLPSKLIKRINRYDLNNDRHGEVDLTLFQSKEFYNYLNQSWVFSGLILVEDTPRSQGRKILEALDKIILLIEDELEE